MVTRHSRMEKRIPSDPQILVKAANLLEEVKRLEGNIFPQHENMRMVINNDRDEDLETNVVRIGEFIERIYEDMGSSSP